jgi:hypothetical protein
MHSHSFRIPSTFILSLRIIVDSSGLLLKAATRQSPSKILGLETPIAAGSIILFPWTVGAMHFVCLVFTAWI